MIINSIKFLISEIKSLLEIVSYDLVYIDNIYNNINLRIDEIDQLLNENVQKHMKSYLEDKKNEYLKALKNDDKLKEDWNKAILISDLGKENDALKRENEALKRENDTLKRELKRKCCTIFMIPEIKYENQLLLPRDNLRMHCQKNVTQYNINEGINLYKLIAILGAERAMDIIKRN